MGKKSQDDDLFIANGRFFQGNSSSAGGVREGHSYHKTLAIIFMLHNYSQIFAVNAAQYSFDFLQKFW